MTIKIEHDEYVPAWGAYRAYQEENHDYRAPYGTGRTELDALMDLRWVLTGVDGLEDVVWEVDQEIRKRRG